LPERLPTDLSALLASLGNHPGNGVLAARPAPSRHNARSALFPGNAENP
jgi:hypothetical protein